MANEKVVKITKRDNINSLLQREDLTESERTYLVHELELLDKKNAYKAEKNAEKNVGNLALRKKIFDILGEHNEGLTCSKISSLMNNEVTAQKIRPQLTALINEGSVENYKEKGVSLFRVVG